MEEYLTNGRLPPMVGDGPDYVDRVLTECKAVAVRGAQTGGLQKVSGVIAEGISGQILNRPTHHDDFRSTQVGALETVQVGSSLSDLLFKGRSVSHHRNRLVGVKVGLAVLGGEAKEGLLRIFKTTATDEPPWTFWSQSNTNEKRHWPHPLQSIRNLVCPLICSMQHRPNDTNSDELTQAPHHIDICGQVSSKCNRAYCVMSAGVLVTAQKAAEKTLPSEA